MVEEDYVEFFYNKQNLKRYLKNGESETDFICPRDCMPILKKDFDLYICVACDRDYARNELKILTKEKIGEYVFSINKLEKSLGEINKNEK